MVAAGDIKGARAVRDEVIPELLVAVVDPTWTVAACVTAQLCWETGAGPNQTEPLLQALCAYPGTVAVLGRFIGECGPVQRYLGLLASRTATVGPGRGSNPRLPPLPNSAQDSGPNGPQTTSTPS